MMWHHGIGWHWLGTLAMILFWTLIIVLALAPIKYLRAQLDSPELGDAGRDEVQADGKRKPAAETPRR
ncbi:MULTISPECIES: hypothetical protein [Oxalobacteraceae]|uniref:hypothetical protein n=1 Tax=Oxalobacteraceae TaxID=75682 RepID=UPI0010A42F43|nr:MULTISPECIES: hypothetical protein [Oxalobacteraceae]